MRKQSQSCGWSMVVSRVIVAQMLHALAGVTCMNPDGDKGMAWQPDIDKGYDILNELNGDLGGRCLPADSQEMYAAALLDLALEHYQAMLVLLEKDLHGSVLSLVRLLFETTAKGSWMYRCADDRQMAEVGTYENFPLIKIIISDLERLYDDKDGILNRIVSREVWQALCGYTHGDMYQISKRITGSEIAPSYPDDLIKEVFNLANLMFYWIAVEALTMIDENELALKWASRF